MSKEYVPLLRGLPKTFVPRRVSAGCGGLHFQRVATLRGHGLAGWAGT